MINENYKHSEITEKIIGCAMKVHRTLGNGFQEVIYQRCLAIEMEKQGLKFVREIEMEIHYDEIKVGTRRADFFVEEKVMVETKAEIKFIPRDLTQGLNYLEAFKLETGLLLNFGAPSLEFKRLINERKLNR